MVTYAVFVVCQNILHWEGISLAKKKIKEQLKSVTVILRDSAVESIEEIQALNDCISCEVTSQNFNPSFGLSGKEFTIFPASIKSRGGKYILKPHAPDVAPISIERKDMLRGPKQVQLTL